MGEIDVYCLQCPSCGNVLDFLNKDEIVCPHCKNKVYRSKERQNVNMKFEFAFVSDGASYKDKYNEQMKKLGDFSGEYDASAFGSEIDIESFVKKVDTTKFKTKIIKKKIDAVELAKLDGLIQRLHFEYGGENSNKVLTSDKALKQLLKAINEIDDNNIYSLFIEKFVFMRSLSFEEVKGVLTRADALEIADYILPFFKIKEVRDEEISKLICTYILNTSVPETQKWEALKSVLLNKQKIAYSEFANVFRQVVNFDLDLIELSEFEKLFSEKCLSKITLLNEKLDALYVIRSSSLLLNIKIKFYTAIFSSVNGYFEDFKAAMCYLGFLTKVTELDEKTKQDLIKLNIISNGEKKVNYTKNFTLEQRLTLVRMLCFGSFIDEGKEDTLRFVFDALTCDIYTDNLPFEDAIKVFDIISKVECGKKSNKLKAELLIKLVKMFKCAENYEVVSFLNYITTAKIEDEVKREVFISVLSSPLYKPTAEEAMGMFDYIFNLDAACINSVKNEILEKLLEDKIEVFASFSELDGMVRYLHHLKAKEEDRVKYILALLVKGEKQQNILLSFEGVVSFVKYFENDRDRLKYLFPLFITYRDELFYSLKPLLILYGQGGLNKNDLALAFKVIKSAKMPKVEAQNKAVIFTTLDQYAKEYKLENLDRQLFKLLKEDGKVLKQVALEKNYEGGKEKPELTYLLYPYYEKAENFGFAEAKIKVSESARVLEKNKDKLNFGVSKGRKRARLIVSVLLMMLLPTLIILCAPYFSHVIYLIIMSLFTAVIYLLLLVKIIKDNKK